MMKFTHLNDFVADILIVDDRSENLKLLKDMLSKQGYKVSPVSSGVEALEAAVLAAEPGIDLLFTDVVMSRESNGYELAQMTTNKYPSLKILLTSGYMAKSVEL
jgi:CheY-like chemotaxis protein